ncbi:MAG: response regulator [Chloroflexi bacterium CFX4]|nr:response regulator [Chloroflexi bacterium CFX4]MDL1921065.1 response regulator [Chloroflexi bacterium CFX3]
MAEKILIVDDDIDSLKLIGLMLQRQGYEVTAASNGTQAIARATAERPDLIILDVMMPDLDGYEICRRLRANPTTQPIPIIMFTAKTLIDDKVQGFEAGADDYLAKPTHPAELASRVKALLMRSAAQRRTAADGGSLIAFLGAKGGVGTSTLAANIAASMQQKAPTVLADIRPGQGSLGLSLNAPRAVGMMNLLGRPPAEINTRVVEAELATHPSGLKLLLSSARPKDNLLNVNVDSAVATLKTLRGMARHGVLDLGSGLTRLNARLMREVDQVVVVAEPNRVTLNMAREMVGELEGLGLGRGRANVVIVNRTPSQVHVPWQEAEQLLGHEILALVTPAPELSAQAAEAGTPMVLFQPTSIVATQMTKLAEELAARGSALAANA